MLNSLQEKSVIVTGAGSGFGRLISEKSAKLGAMVICVDRSDDLVNACVKGIRDEGGRAIAAIADVTDLSAMKDIARTAQSEWGKVDVIINNAGIMPLAFFEDHEQAMQQWHKCIDVNIKGVLNGIASVYDIMINQGAGHVINISSIYGNHPVAGAAVYGATKSAVNYISEALRVESRGKIKVTIVKPTGVPTTGLNSSVVNPQAAVGIAGHNAPEYIQTMLDLMAGQLDKKFLNSESPEYAVLSPEFIADQVIHAMAQPSGVSVGDITIRATGDHYIL